MLMRMNVMTFAKPSNFERLVVIVVVAFNFHLLAHLTWFPLNRSGANSVVQRFASPNAEDVFKPVPTEIPFVSRRASLLTVRFELASSGTFGMVEPPLTLVFKHLCGVVPKCHILTILARIRANPVAERKRKKEWQVIRMRARGEYLGVVSAPDQEAALKAALKAFALEKIEETRLLVRPHR
jgi:hypothetical protein